MTKTLGDQSAAVEKSIEHSMQSLLKSQDYLENVAIGLGESSSSAGQASRSTDEISHFIDEQKISSADIAQHIENIARMSGENARAVEEVSSVVNSIGLLASKLNTQLAGFKV